MGKRSGAGNRSSDGTTTMRNRIEGFGNGPMPPPVADNFEDRLHNALSQDETFGDWYNNARASVDSMVTAFDDTVNAIADSIEDTVSAVIGDDDAWEPENQQQTKNQSGQRRERKNRTEKDDGERSDVKWPGVVEAICDEGDLDNFVLLVRSQCANTAEEREVAGLLSEHLLKAEKSSNVIRVLYVMQSIEEGDLPVVMDVIREKCQAKLEKLKHSTFFRALATQVLGSGPPEKTEKQKKEEKEKVTNGEQKEASKAAPKPVDLLDMNESAKPQGQPAASSAAVVDLLDMSAPAAAVPPRDLLSLDATPVLQPINAPPPAASNSTPFLQTFPGSAPAATASPALQQQQASAPFASFPPAPQQSLGQWGAFQTGSGSSAPAAMGMPPKSGGNLMSQPFGSMSSTSGYNQGFGPSPVLQPTYTDCFDPNAKSSIGSGPPIFVTGTSGSAGKVAPHDPFATLSFPGVPSLGQVGGPMQSQSSGVGPMGPAGNSGNQFGRSSANQPAAQKDALQLDDVLSSELAKMKLVT